MTILPLHPANNASPEALHAFLAQCRAAAVRAGRPRLVSISLAVDALDPLAVLESIFEPTEPHFYAERPSIQSAIAGAEIATSVSARGPGRFAEVQAWMDGIVADTIAVGDVNAPFGGPHFFAGFTFHDEVESGEAFAPAFAFVPRWQVALAGDTTTAVANFLVAPDADLAALTERVWRAHAKFRRFDFSESGTGVPPVGIGEEPEIHIREGAYLPHWTRDGAIYAVTFRLADSLPAHVLETWRLERMTLEQRVTDEKRPLPSHERAELERLQSERIEAYLDSGAGECHLRRREIAELVVGALRHFAGQRYQLHEWCVMPNHVHAVVQPSGGNALADILHSWKSYTAKEANRVLGRAGDFWQAEYYDHLIRDEADYARAIAYVRSNPEKAGLRDWPCHPGSDRRHHRSALHASRGR